MWSKEILARRAERKRKHPNNLKEFMVAGFLSTEMLEALTKEIDPKGRGIHHSTITRLMQYRSDPQNNTAAILALALSKHLGCRITPRMIFPAPTDIIKRSLQTPTNVKGEVIAGWR